MIEIDKLSALVTGRTSDLFLSDIESRGKELDECLCGSRVMIIGGAGSIGRATIFELVRYRPDTILIVDQNENNLAELVREFRSGLHGSSIQDFRTLPLDYGSSTMCRFLAEEQQYDYILNFAALKHVRSEKNVYSLLQMLDTNLVKGARFLHWIAEMESTKRYFCVSTDKAANPVNLMGASKRIMEHLIFSDEIVPHPKILVSSARFANVAFSDGSLLAGFLNRLQKKQPLAVPRDTRRYFISLRESGQICLLAAVFAPDRCMLVPRLDPEADLIELETVAESVLRYFGYEPRLYEQEQEARINFDNDIRNGCYPVLITPLDTTGEKPFEEFVGNNESCSEVGMKKLLGVNFTPLGRGKMPDLLQKIEKLLEHPEISVTKTELVQWIKTVIPDLRHVEVGKNLDERM